MDDKSLCHGCVELRGSGCSINNMNKNKQCPCTECLIKPMCTYPCDDFRKYHDHVQYEGMI